MKKPDAEPEGFQIRGETHVYDNVVDALRHSRKLGRGAEVIRLSDGALLATVPGYSPPAPRER